jgi:hypothetical protein
MAQNLVELIFAETQHLIAELDALLVEGGTVMRPPPLPSYINQERNQRLLECVSLHFIPSCQKF